MLIIKAASSQLFFFTSSWVVAFCNFLTIIFMIECEKSFNFSRFYCGGRDCKYGSKAATRLFARERGLCTAAEYVVESADGVRVWLLGMLMNPQTKSVGGFPDTLMRLQTRSLLG